MTTPAPTPRSGGRGRAVGLALLGLAAALALGAPVLAPHTPADQFRGHNYAPPMRIRVADAGGLRMPFVYRQVRESLLERRYRDDTTTAAPIRWFRDGTLMSLDDGAGPLLLLGADDLGRDIFSRLLHGARLSLGVTFAGVLGALVLGASLGGLAGALGGRLESILMHVVDFVIVLPGAYLVLVLRGLLPRDLGWGDVFALMAVLFAVAGSPHVARGVRSIVAGERGRDYALAARAAGAGPLRLVGHLLPAARGFVAVQTVLLVPALLVAEVTISFLGLGFPEPMPSWGTMLQKAENSRMLTEAPWMLAPAAALFVVVLAVQLTVGRRAPASVLTLGRAD
jgi:peptide/nickel transport system permease protein